MFAEQTIAVVIPALDEEEAIAGVLATIPGWVDQVVVVDNGSKDATAYVALQRHAVVVAEPRRGYGAACLRGLSALQAPDIVVFLDADGSDDPREMAALIEPITEGNADLVIGSRTLGMAAPGALTAVQRFGNALSSALMRRIWGQACTDLGPFRAIRYQILLDLQLDDLDYGWTVQMQARAFRFGLRVLEVPARYRKRIGRSKISGTVRGVFGAGTKILTTIAREALAPRLVQRVQPRLLVFTRYPDPGTTKTRMIPALGPEGAARLQRDMTAHTLAIARRWSRDADGEIVVRFSGGTPALMRDMFGDDLVYLPQGEGDLGERLKRAIKSEADRDAQAIVAIGCDCPFLDKAILNQAFAALHSHDVTIGPASDGGYYLIGTRHPQPSLFENISWGSEYVLAQTLDAARVLGLELAQLVTLSDVDTPQDLTLWNVVLTEGKRQEISQPRISIVIPTLNEAACLPQTLAAAGKHSDIEIVVADGGSSDSTCALAEDWGAHLVRSAPGRACQMNAGAGIARGDFLLFLHADTRLPFGYERQIESCLARPGTVAGAFRFAMDDTRLRLRFVELGANWRANALQFPFGDQGIFLRRSTFHLAGGFREVPVMEDYELIQRLRKEGRISIASTAAITSARRWRTRGVFHTTFQHLLMIAGWNVGINPRRLSHWRANPETSTTSGTPGCT